MVSYVARRLLLMIPTLFGITVMVFLIARLAPGRPGQTQIEGGGAMSAEEAQALAEWYEKRYGLDLPLWKQYLRWWRGMFSVDAQATAWHGEPLRPVLTYRTAPDEYYMRLADGQWRQVRDLQLDARVFRRGDPQLTALVEADGLAALPAGKAGYADPTVVLADAAAEPIEALDGALERLVPAKIPVRVPVAAPAWTDVDGEPLYENPDDPARPVFQRDGRWFVITPTLPRESWSVLPITDPALRTKLRGRTWVDEDDDYAIPRHAVVRGSIEPLSATWAAGDLARVTVQATADAPTGVFLQQPDGPARLLYQQRERVPVLLMPDGEGWQRLIGATRVEPPTVEILLESALARSGRLAEPLPEAGENGRREQRHAIVAGTIVPTDERPADRAIRRYQHETAVFEVALGESIRTRTTVVEELKRRLPITLMISLTAFPLIYLIAIPCGMLMATYRGKRFDAGANIVLLGLWSVPIVLSATLMIGYVARGGAGVEWFPNNGLSSVGAENWPFLKWFGDRVWHLALPVACIVYGGCAYLAKQMRAAMLDNFTMDYVRTAKAKGVPSRAVVLRHVLRNSLLPIITIFATILPVLIAGSIIIEKIFNIEGMGMLAFRAVQNRDYDVVQSLALIAGVLNLTGLLLADIAYAMADPRISYK